MEKRRTRLILELLENRCLPAAWSSLGPSPLLGNIPPTHGPYAGRISALAITTDHDGAGTDAMFMGAAGGGVWRSSDFAGAANQTSWTPLTDNIPFDQATGRGSGSMNVGAVRVDPSNPRVVYVGTGESHLWADAGTGTGILRSVDGGATWGALQQGPGNAFYQKHISEIIVDPRNPDRVWASVHSYHHGPNRDGSFEPEQADGIYRTNNACRASCSRVFSSEIAPSASFNTRAIFP